MKILSKRALSQIAAKNKNSAITNLAAPSSKADAITRGYVELNYQHAVGDMGDIVLKLESIEYVFPIEKYESAWSVASDGTVSMTHVSVLQ